MQRRYNLFAIIIGVLVQMVCVDAQGQIVFASNRAAGNYEIYVMNADGGNQQNLTNNPHDDYCPSWFKSPFSVFSTGKKFTMWGWLKRVDR